MDAEIGPREALIVAQQSQGSLVKPRTKCYKRKDAERAEMLTLAVHRGSPASIAVAAISASAISGAGMRADP